MFRRIIIVTTGALAFALSACSNSAAPDEGATDKQFTGTSTAPSNSTSAGVDPSLSFPIEFTFDTSDSAGLTSTVSARLSEPLLFKETEVSSVPFDVVRSEISDKFTVVNTSEEGAIDEIYHLVAAYPSSSPTCSIGESANSPLAYLTENGGSCLLTIATYPVFNLPPDASMEVAPGTYESEFLSNFGGALNYSIVGGESVTEVVSALNSPSGFAIASIAGDGAVSDECLAQTGFLYLNVHSTTGPDVCG